VRFSKWETREQEKGGLVLPREPEERTRERQWQSRARRKQIAAERSLLVQEEVRENGQQSRNRINWREVRRDATIIVKCVKNTLIGQVNAHKEAVLLSVC
jgi:hypothetical protein